MALTICNSISRNCFRQMRDWKLESLANGKEISAVPFRRNKRNTSGGNLQFPNGFSEKLLFHLTFNRNFRIFFAKCKYPLEVPLAGCLPFVRINQLGRALNNGKGFSKIKKPTERNGTYHLHFDFP